MPESTSLELEPFRLRMRGLLPDHLGIRLIHASPELMIGEIDVTRELCTAPGLMHGGAIMAFADTLGALGTMANLDDQSGTTTIESKTNFFRGGVEGTTLRGECRPMHRGRRTQVWQTTVLNAEGKLVAQVTQTQMVL
ncbi:MAG: PaaI family thioesterase [Chloroflexi bacterium]|nr:PaaI family thioesterase [Chloroflexota bacterium]MCY3696902.1 PaaI family thioesterase [Chloroflexota bacterium]